MCNLVKKLNYTVTFIIIISIMLIVNTILVSYYRDKLIHCEIRKEIMMNVVLDYSTLLNELKSSVEQYVYTEDEFYKKEFDTTLNHYLKEGKVLRSGNSLSPKLLNKYFSQRNKLSEYNDEIEIEEKVQLLKLDNEEEALYNGFLYSNNKVINYLSKVIDDKDLAIINNLEFADVLKKQNRDISQLVQHYLKRYNTYGDKVLTVHLLLNTNLIILIISYLLLIVAHLLQLKKQNQKNYYFNKLYNTIVENANIGIAIRDQNDKYEYTNTKYKEIIEKTNNEIMGKTKREVFGNDIIEIKNILNEEKQLYANGTVKFKFKVDTDRKKTLILEQFNLNEEKGKPKKIIFLQDITATQELQTKLKEQLQEIEYYSSVKDAFIANISHELRTPLHAVVGMTCFLKDTDLTDKQQDYVKNIEISSNILLAVINDILDLSKIRSGSMGLYPTNFKLKEIITTAESMFVEQIKEKGLAWYGQYDFDPDLRIYVDKTRLLQILVNLIGNAYKFTIKGYISLSVTTIFQSSKSIELQFCVSDSGIGIAEEDITKLFTDFEQVENHLTKHHQGTGLGLPICKRIVEQLGGVMWVDSKFCKGSNFYFTIIAPISKPTEKVKERQGQRVSVKDKKLQFPKVKARALLAEDMEINSEIAIKLLNDVGIECDLVTDGLKAVEACKNKAKDYYDIILIDIQMPNMDGYTASIKIRKGLQLEIPIIALTATVVDGITRAKYEGIIDGFLLKPFTVEEFYTSVYKRLVKKDGSNSEEIKFRKERALAVKRLGGLENLYEKHLSKFKVQYARSSDVFMELISTGQYEDAYRYAHSIKGLAGTLGLIDVQQKAAALELSIKERDANKIATDIQVFKPVIEQACKE